MPLRSDRDSAALFRSSGLHARCDRRDRAPKRRAIVVLANRHFSPAQRSCSFATTTAHRASATAKDQAMNIQAPLHLQQTSRPLDGRVSLVTGSTSGIGLGIARALAAAGSAVVLNGFGKPEDIAEAQARIGSEFGVKVRYSPADMSKAAPIAEMVAMTLEVFGRLDILVNNAGIQHVAPLEEFPIEK